MKLFFTILISFSIGWMVHGFLDKDTHAKITPLKISDCRNYNRLSTPKTVEKIVIKEVIKIVPKTEIIYKTKEKEKKAETNSSIKDLFLIALEENKFYDAMNYYEEADEEKHSRYQTALFAYFNKIQKKDLIKAIEQMQYFIEIEPQSKTVVFQLAQLFENQGLYNKTLNIIIDFSYIASYNDKNAIQMKIKSISLRYIEKLKSAKSFQSLVEFLINRINVGVLSDFYSFELAKVYLELKKYIHSAEVLDNIKDNEAYKERAIEMITLIQNKLEEQEEYPIQIPLIRDGLHFLVRAYVDNIPVLLLVDTGASSTSVDYNKIGYLKVVEENALFHTAGGNIYKTIFQANSFTIGSISLSNFKISGTQYSGRDRDGLLGMNFLGKFKFKIDQKEAILFLGEKN